jgi:hypothetical protein
LNIDEAFVDKPQCVAWGGQRGQQFAGRNRSAGHTGGEAALGVRRKQPQKRRQVGERRRIIDR